MATAAAIATARTATAPTMIHNQGGSAESLDSALIELSEPMLAQEAVSPSTVACSSASTTLYGKVTDILTFMLTVVLRNSSRSEVSKMYLSFSCLIIGSPPPAPLRGVPVTDRTH